jgi:outer membrane immunogenic protein
MPKIHNNLAVALFFASSIYPSMLYAAPREGGPYLGAYFGAGLGNTQLTTQVGGITNTSYFITLAENEAVDHAGSWSNHPNSAVIGIQAGHDWVIQRVVYGIVLDYGALPLQSTDTITHAAYPDSSDTYSMETSMSTHWLFTLRGRLGYETRLHWPSFVYVTGGMAMTDLEVSHSFHDNSALAGLSESHQSDNQIGWTAGAGVEITALENLSLNLEYLYVQVPSVETTSTISNSQAGFGIPENSLNSSFSSTGDFGASVLKIGFIYRFNE